MSKRVEQLAERIADYVATSRHYDEMTKRDAIIAAVTVLASDSGAIEDYRAAVWPGSDY